MQFFKMLLAKEPELLLPQAPAEPGFQPRISKLVREANSRVKNSASMLGHEIEKAISDMSKGEWNGDDDNEKMR